MPMMTQCLLEALVHKARENKLTRLPLVVSRTRPPKGTRIRVNGMGTGEVASGYKFFVEWKVVAWFYVDDVERYIAKVRAQNNGKA